MENKNIKEQIINIINESVSVKNSISSDPIFLKAIDLSVDIITDAFKKGNKLLFCGNGGSAADAQHLAAEFTGRFYIDRKALPAEALHCNTSYVTAVGNDYGYEFIYSRIVEGIAKPGDVLIGLSTSGRSKNIVNAMRKAREKDVFAIGFTPSSGGDIKTHSNILFNVPSNNTPRIQEAHLLIGHIICELVEKNIFKK